MDLEVCVCTMYMCVCLLQRGFSLVEIFCILIGGLICLYNNKHSFNDESLDVERLNFARTESFMNYFLYILISDGLILNRLNLLRTISCTFDSLVDLS